MKTIKEYQNEIVNFLEQYGSVDIKNGDGFVQFTVGDISIMLGFKGATYVAGGVKHGQMVIITELERYGLTPLFNQIKREIV